MVAELLLSALYVAGVAAVALLALCAALLLVLPLLTEGPRPSDTEHIYVPPFDALDRHAPRSLLSDFAGAWWFGHALSTWATDADACSLQLPWFEACRRQGKLAVAMRVFCFHWHIIPVDPRDVHHILVRSSPLHYDKPRDLYDKVLRWLLGMSLVTLPNGADHSRIRRLLNPMFVKSHAEQVYGDEGLMAKHIEAMMQRIRAASSAAADGAVTSYRSDIEQMATNITASLFYNRADETADGQQLTRLYQRLAAYFARDHASLLGPPSWMRPILAAVSPRLRALYNGVTQTNDEVRRLVGKLIGSTAPASGGDDAAAAADTAQHDRSFIQLMAKLLRDGSMTREEVEDAALQISFAASETSSGTIFWALYYVARDAALQQQLLEELRDAVALAAVPTFSDLRDLPLLDATIKETMRLVPAVSSSIRVATRDDDTLPSGLRIRAGEQITIPIISLHHRSDIWGDDALDFKPQRWLTERVRDMVANPEKHGLVYLPFMAGSRDCVGRHIAMVEMKLTLAALVRAFAVGVSPATQPVPIKTHAFTVRPSYVPKLTFTARTS